MEPLNLSDLADLIDIPLSTCHGLVKTLQDLGYLFSVGGSRRLYPTKKLFVVAEMISRRDPIAEYLTKSLSDLRDASGETAILGTRQGDSIVYLDVRESENVIRYSALPGDIKPLYSSSIGKLVLGDMPEKDRTKLLDRLSLRQITPNTVTDANELKRDLDACRATGVYVTRGENVADVMAMAVPLRISGDLFGIALAGPIERMTRREEELGTMLLNAIARIAS